MEEVVVLARTNNTIPPIQQAKSSYRDSLFSKQTLVTSPIFSESTHTYDTYLTDESNAKHKDIQFIPTIPEDKDRMYKKWATALIIKVYGCSVRYSFLLRKIHELWKPTEELSLIDLGSYFYLVNFTKDENYRTALDGGPLFISSRFLVIRRWQPCFQPSQTSFSYTALWIRVAGITDGIL